MDVAKKLASLFFDRPIAQSIYRDIVMTHPQSGREVLFWGFENSTDKETIGAERRGIPLPAVRIEFHAVGGGREAEAE